MNPIRVLAVSLGLALMAALPVMGQEMASDDPLETATVAEPELTWRDFSVKAYTVQVFGGRFGGAQYLNLPIIADRVQFATRPRVMSYRGDWWRHGEHEGELDYNVWDSPIKTIEDGLTFGLKLGSYITDDFHLDFCFAYSSTQAVLTMVNIDEDDPNYLVRSEIDRDPNVQILRAALQMTYDIRDFQLFGFQPYFGLGFGGVLNRFSNLTDVGSLFLVGSFGMIGRLSGDISLFLQTDMTTFTMARDELHYTTLVTYRDFSAGLSFYFDVVPPEIRSLHEAQQAERRRRR